MHCPKLEPIKRLVKQIKTRTMCTELNCLGVNRAYVCKGTPWIYGEGVDVSLWTRENLQVQALRQISDVTTRRRGSGHDPTGTVLLFQCVHWVSATHELCRCFLTAVWYRDSTFDKLWRVTNVAEHNSQATMEINRWCIHTEAVTTALSSTDIGNQIPFTFLLLLPYNRGHHKEAEL